MDKRIIGMGFLRGGAYESIFVAGCAVATGEISVKKMQVKGTFRGKGIRNASYISVEGVAHLGHTDFAEKLCVAGRAVIRHTAEERMHLHGEGEITANRLICGEFQLTGTCQIRKLHGETIHMLKDERRVRTNKRFSRVEELACDVLEAHDLKAKFVTAKEVHLYGNSEIETLISSNVTLHDTTCMVAHQMPYET